MKNYKIYILLIFVILGVLFFSYTQAQTGPVNISATVERIAPPPIGGVAPFPPVATRVVLQGKAQPLSSITVLMDGRVAAITTADDLANFEVEIADITAGIWTFGVRSEDRKGDRSLTFSFTTRVMPEMITTISGIFIPPTIELDRALVGRGEVLNIFGQTAPGSEVTIQVESPKTIISTTTAAADGSWRHSFDTSPLEEGRHTARAKAALDGSFSSFSNVLAFVVGEAGIEDLCPRADLNRDGRTGFVDFSIMLYWWGKVNPCADQKRDGWVNLPDFSIMLYWWTG